MVRYLLVMLLSVFIISGCGTQNQAPLINSGGEDKPVTAIPSETEDVNSSDSNVSIEDIKTKLDIDAREEGTDISITLTNTADEDVRLTFTSGQKYEIVIENQAGQEVYRYSIDKSFIMALQNVEIKAGDEITWQETWDYLQTGERIPSGDYVVKVDVLATQINGKEIPPQSISAESKVTVPNENVAFRNIKVEGSNGEYKVIGEARVFEASFFYAVENGHDYVIDETVITTQEGAPEWSTFELNISIPSDKIPNNGTLILQLFERSAKDGEIVNLYSTPLESFN
jgi:hypothetical protein